MQGKYTGRDVGIPENISDGIPKELPEGILEKKKKPLGISIAISNGILERIAWGILDTGTTGGIPGAISKENPGSMNKGISKIMSKWNLRKIAEGIPLENIVRNYSRPGGMTKEIPGEIPKAIQWQINQKNLWKKCWINPKRNP